MLLQRTLIWVGTFLQQSKKSKFYFKLQLLSVAKIHLSECHINYQERHPEEWAWENEMWLIICREKKEGKLVEMFTTIAIFITSCLANSMFPSPSRGQFTSSTHTEHKPENLGEWSFKKTINSKSKEELPLHYCKRLYYFFLAHLLHVLWRKSKGRNLCVLAAFHLPSTCLHRKVRMCNCNEAKQGKMWSLHIISLIKYANLPDEICNHKILHKENRTTDYYSASSNDFSELIFPYYRHSRRH